MEQTKRALEVINRLQPKLNAFAHIAPEAELMALAEALDLERIGGKIRSPLHGLPISVKDVIHVKGMPTSSGSKVMEGFMPADDATAVRLLRAAGAIIVGKAQTHEFALGVTTPQSRNPWDTSRDPGGSSGGSAITVATGMSLLSVGTDTRASIRVPASLCGTLGYKPTYGLVSTDGIVTLSWSMDHTGLMGRTSEDVAIMMNVLQGVDPRDPGTLDRSNDDYTGYLFKDVTGFRVGLAVEALEGADPETLRTFNACVESLKSLGVEVVETKLPSADDFRLCNNLGLIISRVEAAAYHTAFPDAGPKYITQVFEQLDEAAEVKAIDYINAQRFRSEFQERMLIQLQEFDAFIMPTTPVPAPKTEDTEQYLTILSRNCIPWSMIGFPTLSVPAGLTSGGLPVGAQLVSAPFDDGIILALASSLESVTEELRPYGGPVTLTQTIHSARPQDGIGRPATVQIVGAKANSYLSTPGFSGQVIAVGSRFAYIGTRDGSVLAACRPDQQPHPRSFLTDINFSTLHEGTQAWVEDSHLRFSNDLSLSLKDCQVWDRQPLEPSIVVPFQQLRSRCAKLLRVALDIHQGNNLGLALPSLARDGDAAALPSSASPLVVAGIKQVRRLIPLCRSGNFESVLRNAEHLIGLGPGLTPSGDDFIGGLLFMAFHLSAAYPAEFGWDGGNVGNLLARSASMTNRISYSLLTDLAEGQGHESLHDLVDGLLSGTWDSDAAARLRRVTEIGHSSGWDMLTGMLAGTLLVIG